MSRPAPAKPMCYVEIGSLLQILMPAADAQKLMALMVSAAPCHQVWDGGERYVVSQEPLKVSIQTVAAKQVRMPPDTDPMPLRAAPARLKGPVK